MKRTPWERAETQPPRSSTGAAPPVSIVVYHQQGAEIIPLVPGACIQVGRAPEASISIPEPTLSRQHVQIELIGNEVWIEDLDSSNGTCINGVKVKRGRLRPGDNVTLGTMVTLSIHVIASYVKGLEHHSLFMTALEEEVKRVKIFGHQLALLMVRPTRESNQQQFSKWCPQVRQILRPVDRVALHSPGLVEILLPESNRETAVRQAERIIQVGHALRCGVVLFPGAAESAESLLATCLEMLERATAPDPVVVAHGERPEKQAYIEGVLLPRGEAMKPVYETMERVAPADLPILLIGETGTGKEIIAREIHQASPRRKHALCSINCGAIQRELIQSTLFGHERGSFTGANQQQKGIFDEAHKSTLLLDEIGELSLESQVALLRVLETGRVTRLGSSKEIPVDVRIISATHRNLETMCEAGSFRWDLYYRLNTITIKIPPLRQRQDEIRVLAEHFNAIASRLSHIQSKEIDREALQILLRYQWPGNIRELRNTMERAMLVATGNLITVSDLPPRIREAVIGTHGRGKNEQFITPIHGSPQVEASIFKNKVRSQEIKLIRQALERARWNKTKGAQLLQMPLRTLMHKIRVYGIKKQAIRTDETLPSVAVLKDGEILPGFKKQIQDFEIKLIEKSLQQAQGNKAEAARRLDLPLSTLLYKMKTFKNPA